VSEGREVPGWQEKEILAKKPKKGWELTKGKRKSKREREKRQQWWGHRGRDGAKADRWGG